MATKRKAWFRVSDAVLHAEMSNRELATLVRLRAYMHALRIDDLKLEGVSSFDAMLITGLRRPHLARKALAEILERAK